MEIHRIGPVWVLVAHESGARIFGRLNHLRPIELLQRIDHPIGRAKTHELVSDRAGRDIEWSGPARHGVGERRQPTFKIAADFARDLARAIDIASDLNRFEYLIIVAAPPFLGLLRRNLSASTSKRVVGTLTRNLGTIQDRDVPVHINPAVEDFYRNAGLKRPA